MTNSCTTKKKVTPEPQTRCLGLWDDQVPWRGLHENEMIDFFHFSLVQTRALLSLNGQDAILLASLP